MKKKIVSFIAALGLCVGMCANVSAFSDMPDGVYGEALQNAVDVGLINGVTDDLIAPDDNITRAQMATIITRAFCAEKLAEDVFDDVIAGSWYEESVSKAVAMGAFDGDENNHFNPENNITFQETYIVLSRVFGFEPYEIKYKGETTSFMLGDCEDSVLDSFADKGELADWAKNGAKYIVGNGGWTGIDGKLKPAAYITRAEFALLMDSMVETYIDEPGEYNELSDGLIMVRCGGVTIDGLDTDSNLIITYGVDEKGCIVKNSTVNGVTLVLGGVDKTPQMTQTNSGKTKLLADESYIKLEGSYYDVRLESPYVYLNASNAKVKYFKGVENSLVSLSFEE